MHGFYASMGGFVFDIDKVSANGNPPYITGHTRLTLTARGVALLMDCGLLPEVRKEEIKDKSKTDRVAKFLSCLQAMWMLIQTIERAATGLPVMLLEVNTLAHILSALFIYVLWWHKPRLIREPTQLSGEWVDPVCAYMFMSSRMSGKRTSRFNLVDGSQSNPELSMLAYVPQNLSGQRMSDVGKNNHRIIETPLFSIPKAKTWTSSKFSHPKRRTDPFLNTSTDISTIEIESTPMHAPKIGTFELRPPLINILDTGDRDTNLSVTFTNKQDPSSAQNPRWKLAAEAMNRHDAIGRRVQTRQSKEAGCQRTWLEPCIEELLTDRASNWPSEGLLRGIGGLIIGMVLWFASMAYEGAHAAAWNEYFPSAPEAWMWRSSAVFIAGSGFIWFSINGLARQSKLLNAYWDRVVAGDALWTSYLFLGITCSVCGLLYVLARIILVVEAFISIR